MITVQNYEKLTSESKRLYERAYRVMPSGNTRTVLFYSPYPAYARRAAGSRIWDVDGNERRDYCYNFTVLILGHNHPKVVGAIRNQLEQGTVFGAPTELEVKLAEEIRKRAPHSEQVSFSVTGTEAVMNAVRLARAYTGKDKIAMCQGAYHGSYDSVYTTSAGIPQDTIKNTLTTLPFNNIEVFDEVVRKNRKDLAALVIEPVHRCIPPKEGFLKAVREITEENEVLLIFDEIITGFRLSTGGASEYYHVVPDLVTYGKIIGGGFPVSALGGKKEIMSLFSFERTISETNKTRLPHSGTFNAHPVAVAAGLAMLSELTPRAYEHINKLGKMMRDGLAKLSSDLGIFYRVVGAGSLFHIFFTREEVVDHSSASRSDPRLLAHLDLDLLVRGFYLAPAHFSCVSTANTAEDVELTLEAVAQSLRSLMPIIRKLEPKLTEQRSYQH